MSKKLLLSGLILFIISNSFAQDINIGIRDTIYSKVLEESRPLSIYFPPSYYYKPNRQYPVLYILDGDYNFQYVAGLLELQAGIAENIPEMILVGISGKGSTTYLKNCKPEISGVEGSGNADQVLEFIDQELVPYIDKKYKTLDYKMLAGHSIGGLFIVNAALKRPQLFNQYIAISPALWWEDNAINKVAEEFYKSESSLKTDIYLSLADEKRMGVKEFLENVGAEYKFKKFENENHNSVGGSTYKWALQDIFKNWKTEKRYFDSSEEMLSYKNESSSHFSIPLPIAEGVLYNTIVYVLKDKPEELEKAKDIINANYPDSKTYLTTLLATDAINKENYEKAENLLIAHLKEHPDSFELYEKLAGVHIHQQKNQKALEEIEKAIRLAKSQGVRQWRIEEIKDLKHQAK